MLVTQLEVSDSSKETTCLIHFCMALSFTLYFEEESIALSFLAKVLRNFESSGAILGSSSAACYPLDLGFSSDLSSPFLPSLLCHSSVLSSPLSPLLLSSLSSPLLSAFVCLPVIHFAFPLHLQFPPQPSLMTFPLSSISCFPPSPRLFLPLLSHAGKPEKICIGKEKERRER